MEALFFLMVLSVLSFALSLFLSVVSSCFDISVVLLHLFYFFFAMLESFLKCLTVLGCPLMNETLSRWLKSLCEAGAGGLSAGSVASGFTAESWDTELAVLFGESQVTTCEVFPLGHAVLPLMNLSSLAWLV